MMQKTIYFPDDGTWDRIADAARAAGESISEYLRKAADERMQRERHTPKGER